MKNAPLFRRIGYALAGWRVVWRNERSFRLQVFVAAGATAGIVFSPSLIWSVTIVLTVATVLSLKCINSAIEYLVDALHPDLAPGIGAAKDAAAGAVLIASVAAMMVGACFVYSVLS